MPSIFEDCEDDQTFMGWTPKLKKCCCLSLEKGTKLIGYCQMVFYGLISVLTLYDGFVVAGLKHNSFFYVPKFLGLSHLPKCIFGTFLPLGIRKENRSYLLAWLLVTQLTLLENLIIFIFDLRFNNYLYEVIIFNCIDIFSGIYFLLIVHSYYCSLSSSTPNNNYPPAN